jgi:hypothetical protein
MPNTPSSKATTFSPQPRSNPVLITLASRSWDLILVLVELERLDVNFVQVRLCAFCGCHAENEAVFKPANFLGELRDVVLVRPDRLSPGKGIEDGLDQLTDESR